MPVPHRRCVYMNEAGLQCETWFPALTDSKLCEVHSSIVSPGARNGTNETNKVKYIDLVNNVRKTCFSMTREELESHIAMLEGALEESKARVYAARAVRSEKIDALTEEERKELRKIRVQRAVTGETTKSPKTVIEKLTGNKGLDRTLSITAKLGVNAKDMLDMDMDALLAKFEAAKKQS